MATSWEKSLAVESMHRLVKHFKTFIDDSKDEVAIESARLEVSEIVRVWDARQYLGEQDVNGCLKTLRSIVDGNFKPSWKSGFIKDGHKNVRVYKND